jgi:hypothetical protein
VSSGEWTGKNGQWAQNTGQWTKGSGQCENTAVKELFKCFLIPKKYNAGIPMSEKNLVSKVTFTVSLSI